MRTRAIAARRRANTPPVMSFSRYIAKRKYRFSRARPSPIKDGMPVAALLTAFGRRNDAVFPASNLRRIPPSGNRPEPCPRAFVEEIVATVRLDRSAPSVDGPPGGTRRMVAPPSSGDGIASPPGAAGPNASRRPRNPARSPGCAVSRWVAHRHPFDAGSTGDGGTMKIGAKCGGVARRGPGNPFCDSTVFPATPAMQGRRALTIP